MKIEDIYRLYANHYLVDTDTRNIRKNTIYFALKGANFNGNKFAEEALQKGAIYSIVDEEKYVTNENTILVENVLETLQNLAQYHRKQLDVPIISLTGSNGKTTTKELINAVLSTQYNTTATKGNLNNHIGVPLTLLSMTPTTEIGIVEMGANHHKEIAFLCSIATPDYGYITNFGKAHIEGFGSVQGVIEAKSEMYEYLSSHNKTAFVNPQDKIQLERTKDINSILFDLNFITFIDSNPFVKLSFDKEEIKTNLIGDYNFNNIAAAITIGQHFSISKENIKTALENYVSSNNRSQVIKTANNTIILDAYNANPTSMKAALDSFYSMDSKHKTIILGDMFELGDEASKEHQQLVAFSDSLNFDHRFYIGNLFFETQTTGKKFASKSAFLDYIKSNPITNHTILIKGSRGMALEKLLDEF
jgi:UDP-N-acetylmuramoyl-tripeptide--D-alanyl-D-alanine ligase